MSVHVKARPGWWPTRMGLALKNPGPGGLERPCCGRLWIRSNGTSVRDVRKTSQPVSDVTTNNRAEIVAASGVVLACPEFPVPTIYYAIASM